MEQKIPYIVAEWINDIVLPNLADGYHTAKQIYDEIQLERYERLMEEMNGKPYRFPEGDQPLIDSWMVIPHHKQLFIDEVQLTFDSWEEETNV